MSAELLTIAAFAVRLGVRRDGVRRLMREGMPFLRIDSGPLDGRAPDSVVRIDFDEAVKWLKDRRQPM